MLSMQRNSSKHGFTLVELLIVIVIIAILALIIIPRLVSSGDRARSATYNFNLHQLTDSLEHFHTDCGVYPSTLADLYTAPVSYSSATTQYAGFTAATFTGPYLVSATGISTTILLPRNPYVDDSISANQTISAHWLYTTGGSPLGSNYTLTGAVVPPSGY